MTRKLAIFGEGYTEIALAKRLVYEIAGQRNVAIQHIKIIGGTRAKKRTEIIQAADPSGQHEYYVLLIDCGGDKAVKTRIMEEHENLHKKGYFGIIGIRDTRPDFSRQDIPRLEMGLRTHIKTALTPVDFVLSIMEIEAWFLAEHHHFPRIESSITRAKIRDALGFDVELDDMTDREHPKADLCSCYAIGGMIYEGSTIDRTIESLDFENLYVNVQHRIPHLGRLILHVENFFS